jgi:hypothetical protein
MAEVSGRDADHRVHHRPRCRGRDSEAPREGRGAVPSRSAGHSSPLRRFLSLMSGAAACAGCARGGGSGLRHRCSGVTVLRPSSPVGDSCRSKRSLDACGPILAPNRLPNTVLAWSRVKGISYRSGRQGRVSCGVKVPAPSIARFGGLAYPMHAPVTAYVLLGRKSHGRPVDYPQRWERPGWRANLEART